VARLGRRSKNYRGDAGTPGHQAARKRQREALGATAELDPEASDRLWREIGNVTLLAEPRERAI